MTSKNQCLSVVSALALAGCSPSAVGNQNDALGAVAGEATAAPRATSDGPFGISLESSIDDVAGAKPLDQPGLYNTDSPPKPHSDFESVALVAYPETGICQVRGIGRDLANDGSGGKIRSKVDSLSDALATKYGDPERIDLCSGGSIACESEFWMMTLNDGERVYGYKWSTANDAMKRNKISEIYLIASASNIQTSYPILEFHSENKMGCKSAEESSSASAL